MELTGRLLVAGPAILDPNFTRSVVLVCRHDGDGALGLVLDRPSDLRVAEHLSGWDPVLAEPPVVFVGGPVEPAMAVGLGRRTIPAAELPGWTEIDAGLGLLDVSVDPHEIIPALGAVRVFAGYAGWSPGQLETELREPGGWFVVASRDDDPLTAQPLSLRRKVLRRQRGRVRLYADYPPDPGWN